LNQTIHPFEVIVIDDRSTDSSKEIAVNFAFKTPFPVRIYPNTENRGIGFTRERGIFYAEGDYIAYLSSDDCYCPTFLEKSMKHINFLHATFTDYYRCNSNLQPFEVFHAPYYKSQEEFRELLIDWALKKNMFVNFSSIVIPKSFITRNAIFFKKSLRHGEDLIYLLDTIIHGLRWTNIPQPLIKYRIHKKQGTITERGNIREFNLLWTHIFQRLKTLGRDPQVIWAYYKHSYTQTFPRPYVQIKRTIRKLRNARL